MTEQELNTQDVFPGPELDENPASKHGNIPAGILGALLFSIIGGVIYFLVYQLGFVAGICGLATYLLAQFGYGLLAKTKNKASGVCIAVSLVATVVIIFVAQYFCISFEIYKAYAEWEITIADAIAATPEFLTDPDVSGAFIKDLAFAYIFGIAAVVGTISKNKKK